MEQSALLLQSYAASRVEIIDILYQQKKLDKAKNITDDVVDELIAFLIPFKECSSVISAENYPTFHLIAL